jgi:hypothetical protein
MDSTDSQVSSLRRSQSRPPSARSFWGQVRRRLPVITFRVGHPVGAGEAAYTKSLDRAIRDGYLLSVDRAELLTQAEQMPIPS